MTHLSPLTDVPLQTPSYENTFNRGSDTTTNAHSVELTLNVGTLNVIRRRGPSRLTGSQPTRWARVDAKCTWKRTQAYATLASVDAARSGCLCVHLRVHLCGCVCMCVFVGLSGEPGQSVRCSNGGYKDKRCGEFPGCLFPTSQPYSPILPPQTKKQTGTQADPWIDMDRLLQSDSQSNSQVLV